MVTLMNKHEATEEEKEEVKRRRRRKKKRSRKLHFSKKKYTKKWFSWFLSLKYRPAEQCIPGAKYVIMCGVE